MSKKKDKRQRTQEKQSEIIQDEIVTNKEKKDTAKKSLYQILKEWFTWTKLGVILTGIGVLVSVIIYLLSKPPVPSETETIKSEILQDINLIENTFNPNDLVENDSLISVFETNSLKLASLWKTANEPISYKSYSDKDPSELYYVLGQNQSYFNQFYDTWRALTVNCISIRKNEQGKGIDDAHSVISINRLNDITEFLKEKKEINDKHMSACLDYMQKAVQLYLEGKDHKKMYHKACEQLDLIREEPRFYKCDKALFDFIIQTNNSYLSKYIL